MRSVLYGVLLVAIAIAVSGGKTLSPAEAPLVHPIALFNGKDLSGWMPFIPDPGVNAASVWSVQNGVLRCEGNPHGYIRTEKTFRDYHLRFEWRWPEVGGNSGLLLHITGPDKVWPKCVESQLLDEKAGDFWVVDGADFKQHHHPDNRRVAKKHRHNEKEITEWNIMDVVCDGDSIRVWVNGLLQNKATACTLQEGYLGLQSEGTPIEFRNVQLDLLVK